jgi:hypothetical protein
MFNYRTKMADQGTPRNGGPSNAPAVRNSPPSDEDDNVRSDGSINGSTGKLHLAEYIKLKPLQMLRSIDKFGIDEAVAKFMAHFGQDDLKTQAAQAVSLSNTILGVERMADQALHCLWRNHIEKKRLWEHYEGGEVAFKAATEYDEVRKHLDWYDTASAIFQEKQRIIKDAWGDK